MTKRITHIITGLGLGGAETMLFQVLKHRSKESYDCCVISLGASHYYENNIQELGINVVEAPIGKHPLNALLLVYRHARKSDVLFCWMYHANLIGLMAGKVAGVKNIVWCIRHSSLDQELNSRRTLLINRWCARLSRYVTSIIYNGELSRSIHERIGYYKDKGHVIGNGCDCERFRPNDECRASIETELGIDKRARIVLSVTRNHPIKDLPTFVEAFALLKRSVPDAIAVMCGKGITCEDEGLSSLCVEYGLITNQDIYLLGVREDVERLMAACDLYVLHSASEAFPNVLLQAMSCECLCLSTDVGDARRILANDAQIIPPKNSALLYRRMLDLLQLDQGESEEMKEHARQRILSNYSIEHIVKDYESFY